MRRTVISLAAVALSLGLAQTPAAACAGLIGSNGAVNLGRTTTLAAYHDGVEHYVTAFQFLGGGGQFGTLIPLPGIPSDVQKGGAWTLQRLIRETEPVALRSSVAALAAPAPARAEVLLEKRIDALDITVLKGGSHDVSVWATDRGFRLSPDAPEVLEFYAKRSPIFLAAVFDGDAAKERGQRVGDGTPVHITIPTANPWVPLRILALGKQAADQVNADVFLLTDRTPNLLPGPRAGLGLLHSAAATDLLLNDLRADEGMAWVPRNAWLTKLRVDARAADLTYDLAVDASGSGMPSRVAAGFDAPAAPVAPLDAPPPWAPVTLATALLGVTVGLLLARSRS
ncbi:MAG: DUF2330 domain-containing protein [Chloroflexi bacterium]|nr:DUF2330 domain-containing protein [Chloroflexota bacterium]